MTTQRDRLAEMLLDAGVEFAKRDQDEPTWDLFVADALLARGVRVADVESLAEAVSSERGNMDLSEYQGLAVRTMARDLDERTEMATLALGLAGESGEVGDIVKKLVGHGHPFTPEVRDRLVKEVGDVLWYVATFSRLVLGCDLSEVARRNVEKLAARYPDGFEAARSLNRPDGR